MDNIRTVDFDPQDLYNFLFEELIEEGFVPSEYEVEVLTDIVFTFILTLVEELGIPIRYGEDE